MGVKKDWGLNSRYFSSYSFNRMLSSLANPVRTDGTTSVVIFDSPRTLGYGPSLPLRGSKDHMVRIESTISFYKNKFNLPVWLMGHSAAGVSLAEFTRHLVKNQKQDLISGLIFSAGRGDSRFDQTYNLPALFMVHQDDGCAITTPKHNREIYEAFSRLNKAVTEFQVISGGMAQADPCVSGFHMYYGSELAAAQTISRFISQHNPPARP